MMKLSRITAVSLLASTLIVGLPVAGLARVTDITIEVDGLSCPFCAYGLEKQLKTVENADTPIIDVKEATATMTPIGDDPVDFEVLREAVKKAGFTPRKIRVKGIGRVETVEGQPTLVSEDGTSLFLLEANDVLAGLTPDETVVLEFTGIVLSRVQGEDESPLPTLALVAVTPRGEG